MRSRLVPTLAAICIASAGAAADQFAPVLTIAAGDPVLGATTNEDAAYHYSVRTLFENALWDFDSDSNTWNQITGIAITATGGGTWAYDDDSTDGFDPVTLPTLGSGEVYLLSLTISDYSELIFTPIPDSHDTGTFSFRAWDGSDGHSSGDIISGFDPISGTGGSTAFSSDERQADVTITPVNDPPPITSPWDSTFEGRPGTSVTIPVSDILAQAGVASADIDGDEVAIIVTTVAGGYTWSWADGGSGSLSPSTGSEVVLRPGALITLSIPGGTTVGTTIGLTYRTYDGLDGSGSIVDAAALGSAISAASATATTTVIANQAPVLGLLPSPSVEENVVTGIPLSASDAEGDLLNWSASSTDGNVSFTLGGDTGTDVTLLFDATLLGYGGGWPADVTVTVTDAFGDLAQGTFSVAVHPNLAPTYPGQSPVLHADRTRSGQISLIFEDNDSSASWTYAVATSTNGVTPAIVGAPTGLQVSVTYADPGHSTTSDQFDVTITDDFGNSFTQPVAVDFVGNTAPEFVVTPPALAVAGQPYEGLVLATDVDGDVLALSLTISWYDGSGPHSSQTMPAWAAWTHSGGTGRITATPPDDISSFSLIGTVSDGVDEASTDTFNTTIAVAHLQPVSVDLPYLPVSTPGSPPVYAAIAPGSVTGFTTLLSALAPLSSDVARGWWYHTPGASYRDVESSRPAATLQDSAGVFLASQTALELSFPTTPYPMPFAIDLKPGWTFFGVPPLYDGDSIWGTGEGAHQWDDFCLQREDGTVVEDDFEILDVLAPASSNSAEEPWGYDYESGYQQSWYISSGRGYWVKNRSVSAYRLVRIAYDDPSYRITYAYRGGDAPRSIARSASETPPAPPAGATKAASKADDGSCGAGGLAGLVIAALGLVGLRRGRRS